LQERQNIGSTYSQVYADSYVADSSATSDHPSGLLDYERCDNKGCDVYPSRLATPSDTFRIFQPVKNNGFMAKIMFPNQTIGNTKILYTEIVTIGLQSIIYNRSCVKE
jgi:hypothetical protein